MLKQLLLAADAARRIFGAATTTNKVRVHRARKRGLLRPAAITAGGRYLFAREDVERFKIEAERGR